MKLAIGSDMDTHLTKVVREELEKKGYQLDCFGAIESKKTEPWPKVAIEVAEKVADGSYDQAFLFCWTGTGISLAANKVKGVRAALCNDAETARGARLWNDANILAMSLRKVSEEVAKEILEVWLKTEVSTDEEDLACIRYLVEWEKRQ